MRIISGIAKGKKLLSPLTMETRPTLDRIKESIFDIIQMKIYGSKVIDLFAGTGSLGLEAVSRGALECFLIDKSKDTFNLLSQNVINLKFEDKCKTFNMDSYEAIEQLGVENQKFDIIFIDPPYIKDMIPPAVEIIQKYKMLLDNGIIVTKIDSKEKLYEGTDEIKLYNHRKYGNTIICFYKHEED
jgi:16S rRNA (guanine966-N2)-methyltransferase